MTDSTEATYTGPFPRGTVAVGERTVPFVAGEPITVTAAEAKTLDTDVWSVKKPSKPKADPAAPKKESD